MTLLFARSAGVEPELHRWPELAREPMFGPLTPTSFRMSGRDSLPGRSQTLRDKASRVRPHEIPELYTGADRTLKALAGTRGDVAFSRYIENVCSRGNAASAT